VNLRAALRRVAGVVFPWPPKHERRAAIAQAARRKEHARAAARRAQAVERQITRMSEENHLAEAIAMQIRGGRRR